MENLIKQAQETLPENWEYIDELLMQTDDFETIQTLEAIKTEKYLELEKEPKVRGKRIPNYYKIREKSNLKKFKKWK